MRGCLTSIILLALLAATGYCIWQVHLLRAEVRRLQERLARDESAPGDSMLEHARAALEAIERGELDRAQAELDRLSRLMEDARTVAAARRERLRQRLEAARKAIAQRSANAAQRVEDLVRELARPWRRVGRGHLRQAPAEQ